MKKTTKLVWIDKNASLYELCLEGVLERFRRLNLFLESHFFDDFRDALDFIESFRPEVVISGYCLFAWFDSFIGAIEPKNEQTAFEFYDLIMKSHLDAEFIVFSSIADNDARLDKYLKNENFYFIHKNDLKNLESMLLQFAEKHKCTDDHSK